MKAARRLEDLNLQRMAAHGDQKQVKEFVAEDMELLDAQPAERSDAGAFLAKFGRGM